jgi:hypothetical protein
VSPSHDAEATRLSNETPHDVLDAAMQFGYLHPALRQQLRFRHRVALAAFVAEIVQYTIARETGRIEEELHSE